MITYENFQKWAKEHKQQGVYALCFVVIFFAGFGIGKGEAGEKTQVKEALTSSNYTTNQQPNTKVLEAAVGVPLESPPPPPTTSTQSSNCLIKGNISSKSKIYHVKGGAFYERTQPEQCFNTEAEAVAAGFRKSSR